MRTNAHASDDHILECMNLLFNTHSKNEISTIISKLPEVRHVSRSYAATKQPHISDTPAWSFIFVASWIVE